MSKIPGWSRVDKNLPKRIRNPRSPNLGWGEVVYAWEQDDSRGRFGGDNRKYLVVRRQDGKYLIFGFAFNGYHAPDPNVGNWSSGNAGFDDKESAREAAVKWLRNHPPKEDYWNYNDYEDLSTDEIIETVDNMPRSPLRKMSREELKKRIEAVRSGNREKVI